jgi:hypothetical protein
MISPLDQILQDLIQSRVPGLGTSPTQVGFEPPNDDWRNDVVTANEERLNFYLYDLRENITLRSNVRVREPQNGWYLERKAPPRLDCHYLVTAWSPIQGASTATVQPTRDTHVLLYAALEVLMRHRPLIPAAVYRPGITIPSGNTLNSVPLPLREEQLPMEVALPDGPSNLSEFWSTMKIPWKATVHLVVTVPVILLQPADEGPMVTTLISEYGILDVSGSETEWLSIGGHVLESANSQRVQGAWVQIRGLSPLEVQVVDRHIITPQDGRFLFSHLRAGRYRLHAVAPGLGEKQRDLNLPSPSGEYDLSIP